MTQVRACKGVCPNHHAKMITILKIMVIMGIAAHANGSFLAYASGNRILALIQLRTGSLNSLQ
jgi:hypothetical protein